MKPFLAFLVSSVLPTDMESLHVVVFTSLLWKPSSSSWHLSINAQCVGILPQLLSKKLCFRTVERTIRFLGRIIIWYSSLLFSFWMSWYVMHVLWLSVLTLWEATLYDMHEHGSLRKRKGFWALLNLMMIEETYASKVRVSGEISTVGEGRYAEVPAPVMKPVSLWTYRIFSVTYSCLPCSNEKCKRNTVCHSLWSFLYIIHLQRCNSVTH